jgi:hypothetical protein
LIFPITEVSIVAAEALDSTCLFSVKDCVALLYFG